MLKTGSLVGNVRIGTLLGRGAMGEVYSGEQVSLRRPVAIKRIASHLAGDDEIIRRFAREAQVVALINSPHVVAVHEFGKFSDEDGDEHYLIIMELVDGGFDLKACVGSAITWQQASSIIMQIAEGLTAAAEHDVIHRDIKPDNIMLSKKGIAKLADFGLAKSVESTAMTMQGTLMGTPNYMPPEACRGEDVDSRGDIYSLGATWYHLLSGQPLFTTANTMALLRAHCEDTPKAITECVPGLPQEVSDLVMSCVAKNEADRPQSAEALHKALMKIDGIPQKVPELIRLIKENMPKTAAHSESTIATIGVGASGTAATVVTGCAAGAGVGDFNDSPQEIADEMTFLGVGADEAEQDTMLPSPSAAEHEPEPSTQQAHTQGMSSGVLIGGGLLLIAALAGGALVLLSPQAEPEKIPETVAESATETVIETDQQTTSSAEDEQLAQAERDAQAADAARKLTEADAEKQAAAQAAKEAAEAEAARQLAEKQKKEQQAQAAAEAQAAVDKKAQEEQIARLAAAEAEKKAAASQAAQAAEAAQKIAEAAAIAEMQRLAAREQAAEAARKIEAEAAVAAQDARDQAAAQQQKMSAVLETVGSAEDLRRAGKWAAAASTLESATTQAKKLDSAGQTTALARIDAQRKELHSAASTDVDKSFEQAIAAVGKGRSMMALKQLRGCKDAAQVSGRADEWAEKVNVIMNIMKRRR